jgi:hypothetical protein
MEGSACSKAKEDTAGCLSARDVGTLATLVNVTQQIIKERKWLSPLSGTRSGRTVFMREEWKPLDTKHREK